MAWLQRTTTCLAATLVLVAPIGPARSAPDSPGLTLSAAPSDSARAAYDEARERVAALSANSARLAESAQRAADEAERLRTVVGDDEGGFLGTIGDLLGSGPSDLDLAADAADNAEFALELADRGAAALTEAIDAAEEARVAWERAEREQQLAEASWTAEEAAQAAIERSAFSPSYDVVDASQDRLNRGAQRAWHRQLRAVARNAIVPPTARELADPESLQAPLEPVRDLHNELSPGVAEIDLPGSAPVTVLPAETVRAVSEAFHRVGVADTTDPTTSTCGGLVAQAWTAVALPADAEGQWEQLRPVAEDAALPGDVVVLGSRAEGIDATGLYVGDGRAVLTDPTTGIASVRPIGTDVLGVRRPGVPAGGHRAEAPAGGRCGTDAAVSAGGSLVLPMAPDSYVLTTSFGETGSLWSSGEHTGLDFAAPTGTPVVAAGPGLVTVEHPDWAGNLVRIDHGGGVETWYAHLSSTDLVTGDVVAAGDPVGLVGDLGNTTGPHLHFEVRLDGASYDPAPVLGLSEGPDTALCPAFTGGTTLLPCDAAIAVRLLSAAPDTESDGG
ncbi:M23 family metallopeptidase [Nocardioides sp. SR21]|uniref:M23 family metallopeptidase n=1 Tax=Nocardioides sp. SR21 TaxID=2919501 RepID=UPI001FA988FD|nr:M23 family metallopeptidase [Nocardioides sp. SR21]